MAAITKVPNGPLIKKKGPYAGSTLKKGGVIKKAANGTTTTQTTNPPTMTKRDSVKAANKARIDSTLNARAKKFGFNTQEEYFNWQKERSKGEDVGLEGMRGVGNDKPGCSGSQKASERRVKKEAKRRNGGPIKKAKAGVMIKRADGSVSKRGLWDNIRANKGSGKKPTAAMLKQERKIKAKK